MIYDILAIAVAVGLGLFGLNLIAKQLKGASRSGLSGTANLHRNIKTGGLVYFAVLNLLELVSVVKDKPEEAGPGRNKLPSLDDCYGILGLKRGASWSEIETAFKQAVKDYHPDVKKSKIGSIEDEKTKQQVEFFYNEKMDKIVKAYKMLKKFKKLSDTSSD